MKISCLIFGNDNDSYFNGFYCALTQLCKNKDVEIAYIKRGDNDYKTMMEGFGIEITPCVLFFEEDETDKDNNRELSRFYPQISIDEIITLLEQHENTQTSGTVCEENDCADGSLQLVS